MSEEILILWAIWDIWEYKPPETFPGLSAAPSNCKIRLMSDTMIPADVD